MTPALSAIVVNHRSAAEAEGCVASLAEAFAREAIAGEILLVDCGSGELERGKLARIPADVHVLLEENRGYSGGVNAGLARARSDRLLLTNADVVFLPGAVSGLLRAIEDRRVGAAAPLAVWDRDGRIRLPPGFAPGFFRDLSQLLPGRFPARDDRRFASFARETLRLWEEGGAARHLSGAALAVRREVFDRAGRFDERFPFEYEETEWEDRVRRAGLDLLFAARASVRHLWARSASRSPGVASRRTVSERVYRERRYGRLGRAILERVGSRPRARGGARRIPRPFLAALPGASVAISPNPSRIPFAAAGLERDFLLPEEIAASLPAGTFFFTIFRNRDGRPLETSSWEKPA